MMLTSKAPVRFNAGLQNLTAMSTMKVGMVAAALAMKGALFLSNMMAEIGFGANFSSVPLCIGNAATLHGIWNRIYSARTKLVALRLLYIRQL